MERTQWDELPAESLERREREVVAALRTLARKRFGGQGTSGQESRRMREAERRADVELMEIRQALRRKEVAQ